MAHAEAVGEASATSRGGAHETSGAPDAIARLSEGAPVYAALRPIALLGVLERAGVAELPSVKQLRKQLGGIDPFNPAILAAPGIDVAAPVAGALFESAGQGKLYHHRLTATLRDAATFTTFVTAVAASGQVHDLLRVDPESALGRQGVLATAHPSPDLSLALRLKGDVIVLDALQTVDDHEKAPLPAEVLRRYPLAPARPFTVGKGARKLFVPDPQAGAPAAVLYLDGRRVSGLIATVRADDARQAAAFQSDGSAQQKAKLEARALVELKRCSQLWDRAPTTFDDLGVALAAAPDSVGVTLAWGTLGGAPLGGLKLAPVDDGGLDSVELSRDATAVVALYAASLAPFAALKRSGPFVSLDSLDAAVRGCDNQAGGVLIVRSWPLALGALAATPPTQLAAIKPLLSGLRTIVLALRDFPASRSRPRFAVGATFDDGVRSQIEAALSPPGTQQTIGKRNATVYSLTLSNLGFAATVGIDALANHRFQLTVADSEDSLGWAYRMGDAAAARPPVMRVSADLLALVKAGEALSYWRPGQADFVAHLRRVDGELSSDGDTLRLDLHAPLPH
jgi:hypothetical protein